MENNIQFYRVKPGLAEAQNKHEHGNTEMQATPFERRHLGNLSKPKGGEDKGQAGNALTNQAITMQSFNRHRI
jgi:hypothetical protein